MSGIQTIRNGLSGNITRVIVIAIIITFIGSVGWAGFFSQGNANIIAKVGSKEITNANLSFELSSQQYALSQRFPDQTIEDELLLNLSTDVLIGKYAVLDFLENNELILTDSFVYDQLSSEDQFLENGKFSKNRFDAFARSNGFIPSDYLQRVREDLVINIWRQSLANSNFVTDAEVTKSVELAEQERDISFIKFPAVKFKESISFEEDDLIAFYESNKPSYVAPEKVKVSYVSFGAEELKKDINISNDEIALEFNDYIEGFDSTVRKSVSHIMLNVDENRDSMEAQRLLIEINNRLSDGENFSDLVLEISEDEGTKSTKGSLGITDGTLLPPEFESALTNMKEGEVFGPIDLLSSVHLIKLDELIQPEPETLQQRTASIKADLLNRRAEDSFVKLLDEISELAFASGSIMDMSDSLSQEIVNTDYFSRDSMPEPLKENAISNFIFEESSDSDFPEVIELSPLSAVLIQVEDFIEENQLSFQEVKFLVENSYLAEESRRASISFISNIIDELNNSKTLEESSVEQDISIETYKNLKRDSSILPVRAVNEIFSLPRSEEGSAYGSSLTQNGDYLLYRLDSVRDGKASIEEVALEEVNSFLSQQKSLSELSEFQTQIQKGIKVERFN